MLLMWRNRVLCLCFFICLYSEYFDAKTIKRFKRIDCREMSRQRLTALRELMRSQPTPLAAYIIPTSDAHGSEYLAPIDARREWISGFTGSAGTAVVTAKEARVWTDGRYYTQFEREVDLGLWTLMKQTHFETPSIEDWLSINLTKDDVVGVDPNTLTVEEWQPLQTTLVSNNIKLLPVYNNLVDEVRIQLNDPPPARPNNPIVPLALNYSGRMAGTKIKGLRVSMNNSKVSVVVISALDDVASGYGLPKTGIFGVPWGNITFTSGRQMVEMIDILNLRGSDIKYNPVFFSYMIVTMDTVTLFVNGSLSNDVYNQFKEEGLSDIEVRQYSEIEECLKNEAKKFSESGSPNFIWIPSSASEAIYRLASGVGVLEKPNKMKVGISPVALQKLYKNEVELLGFRRCHVIDGISVSRFFRWLHEMVDSGVKITEIQASDKLLEMRSVGTDFIGPSFETISSTGPNAAIVHYKASREGEQKVIEKNDFYLLDSGGQYLSGTTDVTRTRHMGRSPTPEQKSTFTRVLKGQIMMGSALFPFGIKGNALDSFARHSLWEVGLDYSHGTGHGVGHFLNVHEGPSGISWKPYPHDPGLKPGQILSNEPGYYKEGEYGIRIEDLVEIVKVDNTSAHSRAAGLLGDFNGRGVLGFNTLTLVPHQKESIDVNMLTDFELEYINTYHARVLETLGHFLIKGGYTADYKWLQQECAPMIREPGNSAVSKQPDDMI